MSKYAPGDKVTPISVDRYTDRNVCQREEMLGRTLVVRSVHNDEFTSVVFAGFPGEGVWQWHPDDLRLVFETQAEPEADPAPAPAAPDPTDPAPAQKPLRRGDLVMWNGEIGVVHEIDPDGEDGYWVAMLTGDASCVCSSAEDLTRVGSIRKKIKRLKEQFVGDEK